MAQHIQEGPIMLFLNEKPNHMSQIIFEIMLHDTYRNMLPLYPHAFAFILMVTTQSEPIPNRPTMLNTLLTLRVCHTQEAVFEHLEITRPHTLQIFHQDFFAGH